MNRWNLMSTATFFSLSVLAAALPAGALAATSNEPVAASTSGDEEFSDIVVTANRREEKLQSVPISIAAATGTTLQELNIQRPEDLPRLFSGFSAIATAGSAVSSYNIRGVGQSDFSEHEEQPVASYQDGVYVANAAATGFPLFDVARVELLRGPQGTLFGRNATGGLVQFFSNQPQSGFSGYVNVTNGDYNLRRVEGAVNYGTDTLAVRVAGYYSDRDGYIKNEMGQNLLAETVGAVRVQIAYNPSSDTSFTLRLEGFNTTGTSDEKTYASYYPPGSSFPELLPANVNAFGTGPGNDFFGYRGPSNPYLQSVNDPGMIYKRSPTVALSVRHDMGDISLFSISSYNHTTEAYREDSDGSPSLGQIYSDSTDSHSISQELRVDKATGQFRYTGGVYYFNVNGLYTADSTFNFCDRTNPVTCSYATNLPLDPVTGKGGSVYANYSLDTHSEAIFAQGEYDLTDRLTFVLGGRYSWDQQKFIDNFACTETESDACAAIYGVGTHPGTVAELGSQQQSQDHGNYSGKVTLNYRINPDIITYMSVNRGIKSAGYVPSVDGELKPSQLAFLPEQLTSYEPGIKMELLERKLTANLGLFHYVYHNFQTFQYSGVTLSVLNRDGYASGGELEFAARPGFGIDANLGLAYDEFWVKGITVAPGIIAEQHPINSPPWQVNWGLGKSFRLSDDMTLKFGYHGRFTSARYYNVVNTDTVRATAMTRHDADVSIETASGLTLRAYVDNFTNKAYITDAFDLTGQGYIARNYAPPRMFGATVGYKF